jgi:hypothetical protein
VGLKDDENMMAEELRRLLDQLPAHNQELWREVVYFLHEITLQADVNKMSPVNLGIVWGPNVFWDEQVPHLPGNAATFSFPGSSL